MNKPLLSFGDILRAAGGFLGLVSTLENTAEALPLLAIGLAVYGLGVLTNIKETLERK